MPLLVVFLSHNQPQIILRHYQSNLMTKPSNSSIGLPKTKHPISSQICSNHDTWKRFWLSCPWRAQWKKGRDSDAHQVFVASSGSRSSGDQACKQEQAMILGREVWFRRNDSWKVDLVRYTCFLKWSRSIFFAYFRQSRSFLTSWGFLLTRASVRVNFAMLLPGISRQVTSSITI